MCVVFFDYLQYPAYPIFLAANREESAKRPSTQPAKKTHNGISYLLAGEDKGRDGRAPEVGTWLGVNFSGMVVAVTNRTDGKLHGSDKLKSRGVLCHELIKMSTVQSAGDYCIRELKAGGYGGCNFIIMDAITGLAIHAPDKDSVNWREVTRGFHAITNSDIDDMNDERVAFLHESYSLMPGPFIEKAKELCSHKKIIVNDDDWGSVSSSVFAVGRGETGMETRFHHSMTKPTVSSYADLSEMTRTFCGL